MKEFVAAKDGRRLSREDIEYLQEYAGAWSKIFSQYGDFVISGCVPTRTANGGTTITSGWMFIGGRILKYEGSTYESDHLFFGFARTNTSGVYADDTTNVIRYEYKAASEAQGLHDNQIEYSYDSNNNKYVYPTFENTVIMSQNYVASKAPGGSNDVVDLDGILRLTALNFAKTYGAVIANGNEMFLSSNYDPSSADKPGLILFRNGSAVLTSKYPDSKTPSSDTQLGVGSVKCARIYPFYYSSSTTDHHGAIDSTNGKVNILGDVESNGKVLLTEEKAESKYIAYDSIDIDSFKIQETDKNVSFFLNYTVRMCNISGFFSPTMSPVNGTVVTVMNTNALVSITPDNPEAVYIPVFNLDDMSAVGYSQVRNNSLIVVFTTTCTSSKGYVFNGSYALPEEEE